VLEAHPLPRVNTDPAFDKKLIKIFILDFSNITETPKISWFHQRTLVNELLELFLGAIFALNHSSFMMLVEQLVSLIEHPSNNLDFALGIHGSEFENKVWADNLANLMRAREGSSHLIPA
jgi:hypothetical protein